MKNTTILVSIAVIILLVGGFVFANGRTSVTGNAVAGPKLDGQVQKVVLGLKDFNYDPQTITVKAGQPVSISGDKNLLQKGGCLKSLVFNLGDQRASGYLRSANDVVEFTPTKKGAFTFSCSMGMGFGKIIVE